MCMFCAALPLVASITAVAQGEQRKKLETEMRLQEHPTELEPVAIDHRAESPSSNAVRSPRGREILTPRRITQIGALAFVVLLFGSGFYHTHFSG